MEIRLKNMDAITPEKVSFVEEQANKLLSFTMESRSILTKETHTTLNWLFTIIIGSSGYAAKIVAEKQVEWWLVVPLSIVAFAASVTAVRLFRNALLTVSVLPLGNDPKNLVTDELMQHDIYWIRLAEACQLQERIENVRKHNCKVGDQINQARWTIASLPILAIVLTIIVWCFST